MSATRAVLLALLLAATAAGRAAAQADASGEAFGPGDRVLLHVEGEAQLSDTFTVAPGPVLPLPGIGDVPLSGVRRRDLEAHLGRELGRFVRHATVHARALIRIGILGEVLRPGFYAVPVDLVLADAVMVAGGASRDARLDALRIERGERRLWGPDSLRLALAAGRTLDDLGLRAGDRLVLPRREPGMVLRVLGLVATSLAALYGATRLF